MTTAHQATTRTIAPSNTGTPGAARTALLQEFTTLRRGYGIRATNVRKRIGPEIRRVCDIAPDADDPEIRTKLVSSVRWFSRELTVQDRRAIEIALCSERSGLLQLLNVRTEQLATELNLSPRTARRRIDRAFELLADEMLAARQPAPRSDSDPEKGWWVTRFSALLRLDTPTPQLVETRTIRATRDGLHRIVARMSLPHRDGVALDELRLNADLQQGARIVTQEQTEGHFRYVLELPRRLNNGDEHVYTIAYRIPADQPIRTHYAFLPMVACEEFTVRVRFDPARPPALVWRLENLPPVVMFYDLPPGPAIELDGAFEAELTFRHMEQGFGYGVAWRP